MALSFQGKTPAAVSRTVPPVKESASKLTNATSIKALLVDLLTAFGQSSAADAIEGSSVLIDAETLSIQTGLSRPMLPVVVTPTAERLIKEALLSSGLSFSLKILPAQSAQIPPKEELLPAPFDKLVKSAERLNKASDKLTRQVEQIEGILKRLNLGVSAWVTISKSQDEDGNSLHEEIGYVRIGSRWGIALRTREGTVGDPGDPEETFSSFADAPRQLRIRAVEHIPKLIEQLSVEAEAMIASLSSGIDRIAELTVALETAPGVAK